MSSPCATHVLAAGDLKTLRAMLAMFGHAFADPETFSDRPPSDSYLRGLLRNEFFVAIAALQGERVIGGIAGYVLPKYEQARRELYIYDLAVAEEYRRTGVATALIEEARRLAGRQGIEGIFVQADVGDEPATALYSKLGHRAEVLHFDFEPEATSLAPLSVVERPDKPFTPTLEVGPIATLRASRQELDDDFWGGAV